MKLVESGLEKITNTLMKCGVKMVTACRITLNTMIQYCIDITSEYTKTRQTLHNR